MKPEPGSAEVAAWLRAATGTRIAVVGAGGFIGSHVTVAALAAGARVEAVVLGSERRLGEVAHPRLARWAADPERWEEVAIRAAAEVDAVLLLAWRPGADGSHGDERHERAANRDPALRVAEAAGVAGARIVFASSAAVYGRGADEPLDETAPTEPSTAYGTVKLETEESLAAGLGPDATSLRIATVYGPGASGARAIPAFARALARGALPVLHGGGEDVHDYVHVSDVAAAFVNAAIGDGGGCVNVGSGAGRSVRSVLSDVAAVLGRPETHEPAPARQPAARIVLDISLASRRLGLAPAPWQRTLEEEVRWAAGTVAA